MAMKYSFQLLHLALLAFISKNLLNQTGKHDDQNFSIMAVHLLGQDYSLQGQHTPKSCLFQKLN